MSPTDPPDTPSASTVPNGSPPIPFWAAWVPRLWGWYYQNFLRGFCYYLPLLLLLLLPLGILVGALGSEFGPRLLFFHEEPVKQFLAGVSLALFWIAVLFAGYLLWLRDLRHGRLEPSFEDWLQRQCGTAAPAAPPLPFRHYALAVVACVGVTWGVFWGIVAVGVVVFDVFSGPSDQPSEGTALEARNLRYGWLVAGLVFTAVVFAILGLACHKPVSRLFDWASPVQGGSPPEASPGRTGRWAARAAVAVVVAGWLVAVGLLLWWAPSSGKLLWPLVFTVLGLAVTVLAPVTEKYCSGTWSWVAPWLFRAAAGANLVLVYALVSWCISNCPYGVLAGLLTLLPCGLVLGLAMRTCCPARWRELRESLRESLKSLHRDEGTYLAWGLLGAAVLSLWLLLVAVIPALASPVPLVMLVLFGIVAVYGVSAYLVRRRLIIVLGLVVLLAFVAHIQPYRMRFAKALPFYSDSGGPNTTLLDLRKATEDDIARQKTFEDLLREYQANEERLAEIAKALEDRQEESADSSLADERKDQLQKELAQLREERRRHEEVRQCLTGCLKDSWQEMEQQNKVRAGRYAARLKQEYPLLSLEAEGGSPPNSLLKTRELKVWRRKTANAAGSEPLVVVAVSGGGIRAAVWAFLVLKRLELAFAREQLDFPSHVRMISGASGGMLGASYYVVTLPAPEYRPPQKPDPDDLRGKTLDAQQERLGSDFLTPLIQRLVFNDLPGWLSPWPSRLDRGQALEDAWGKYLQMDPLTQPPGAGPGALDVTFASLAEDEREGRRPSLVFTPMMIEDGRRLIVSNLDLRWAISNDGWVIPHEKLDGDAEAADTPRVQYGENHSIEALELFRLFPAARGQMTVATAARMSASFPYFSPAISLPTVPRRRVVDAGYYDNYGVSLTAAWLFSEENQPWIQEKSGRRILLIQIRDGITEKKRQLREPEADRSGYRSRTLEELTSPPEGLYNVRVSSSSFRNDGQLELLMRVEELREELKRTREDYRRAQAELESAQGDLQRGQKNVREGLADARRAQEDLKRLQQDLRQALDSLDRAGRAGLGPPAAVARKGREYRHVPFMVVNFELEATASLSWYLSSGERQRIEEDGDKIQDKIDKILKWWKIVQEDTADSPRGN